jgi:hypothetical protein
MTQKQLGLVAATAICFLSSLAGAATPAAAPAAIPAASKPPAVAAPAPESKPAATAPAPEAKPAAERKAARAGRDARSCLKQADNAGVRRCAEKYR